MSVPGDAASGPKGGDGIGGRDFTLVFELPSRELTDDVLDAFFENGGDVALFGETVGLCYAVFAIGSDDILEAIYSGMEVIETAGVGATVVRVEPDDLVSIGDIAERTARTAESIRLLLMGRRGPGGFPMPVMRVGMGRSRLWRWAEVVKWFHGYEPARWDEVTTRYWSVIATINDVLRQRTCANRSDAVALEVKARLAPALERGCPVAR